MKKFLFALILLLLVNTTMARTFNSLRDSMPIHSFYITSELQLLLSTHGNQFRGGAIIAAYNFKPAFSLGIGAEYTTAPYHDDNNWKLYHLSFLPVFINAELNFFNNSKATPYLQLSSGISFINYQKEDVYTISQPYHVSEQGLYTYAGAGIKFHINNRLIPFAGIGLKGFHMSFNAYDINPHGITMRTGLTF